MNNKIIDEPNADIFIINVDYYVCYIDMEYMLIRRFNVLTEDINKTYGECSKYLKNKLRRLIKEDIKTAAKTLELFPNESSIFGFALLPDEEGKLNKNYIEIYGGKQQNE